WIRDEAARKAWRAEAEDYFKQAIAIEPRTEWHDDALFLLMQFYNEQQRYVDAAATADRFLELYEQGESEFYEPVVNLRDDIRTPWIHLGAGQAFAPGSFIHLNLNYRNVSEATVRVERIEPAAFIQ